MLRQENVSNHSLEQYINQIGVKVGALNSDTRKLLK